MDRNQYIPDKTEDNETREYLDNRDKDDEERPEEDEDLHRDR